MKYTNLNELTKSQSATRFAIDNTPNQEQIENLKKVCTNIFDKVREHFAIPIAITSGFRCPKLNQKIGGAKNSQHTEGKAIDIDADIFGTINNADIFNFIKTNLTFDQLIWEFGNDKQPYWVHVSYNEGEGGNRKQILKATKDNKNKTTYTEITTN